MAHSSENRIDLRGDGRIILYKRTGSKDPVWQARIRVPNSTGYKRVTTKTANQRDAERHCQSKCTRLTDEVLRVGLGDAQTKKASQPVSLFQLVA